jgi:pimeloyl-ACP methyl ester carboxylesterase
LTESQTVEDPGRDFIERSARADGFTIRYWEAGSGDSLVWIHGAGGPQFSLALDLLSRQYRVLVIELPGFGTSEINSRTQSAAEMATTLAELIHALGLAPANVWGTSMGGVVATHLAVLQPDAVKTLVLEGPGPFRGPAKPPSERTPEEMAAAFNTHPERVAYRIRTPPDPERWELVMKLMGPDHDTDLQERLEQIHVPTLAFWGVNDGIIPPAGGRIYEERVPSCSYVLIPDAAHDVQGDQPEAVAEAVGDFLKRG